LSAVTSTVYGSILQLKFYFLFVVYNLLCCACLWSGICAAV